LAVAAAPVRFELAQQRRRAGTNARGIRNIRRDHFAWLALRQVNQWTAKAIAGWHRKMRNEEVELNTVRIGLKAAADLIGLSRVGPLGRPRKVKI
jgi:hypothetical protein